MKGKEDLGTSVENLGNKGRKFKGVRDNFQDGGADGTTFGVGK